MKKLFLVAILCLGFTTIMNAQSISKHAIGLRFGDSDGFGAEVSYQRALKNNNRLELDLGWRNGKNYNGFKITGLYQWVWNIENSNFNWYAGAGGGLGSYSFDNNTASSNETFVFVAGDVGIEYNFEIPLLISLDFRPELGFGDFRNDVDFDIALGLRYRF
mgnify:CR=1 FL=1